LKYVRLGKSGLKVSSICLGTMTYGDPTWRPWTLGYDESLPFFRRALEKGINFFDTADFYSLGVSEEVVGRALKTLGKRQNVVIATKGYYAMSDDPNDRGTSRKHLFDAIDASLKRLGTDYVDLYQIHRLDDTTPMEETLEALHEIVKSGRARYVGASSMYAWQFAKMLYLADLHGWTRFISMQNHYNLAYREEEREMLPLCLGEGIGCIPWSPLARGLLTGTRTRSERRTLRAKNDAYGDSLYTSDNDYDVADRVQAIARERGIPAAQVALAWLLGHPAVTSPIIGATKLEHLDDAVAAVEVKLTDDERHRLEEPYLPHAVAGIV
jgi:aryl-alcohol dehydrogenase (NADP+)